MDYASSVLPSQIWAIISFIWPWLLILWPAIAVLLIALYIWYMRSAVHFRWHFTMEHLSIVEETMLKFSLWISGLFIFVGIFLVLLKIQYPWTGFMFDKFTIGFGLLCVVVGLLNGDSARRCVQLRNVQVEPLPPVVQRQPIEVRPSAINVSAHFSRFVEVLENINRGNGSRRFVAELLRSDQMMADFFNDLPTLRKMQRYCESLDTLCSSISRRLTQETRRSTYPN
ncbi:hypothetical protein M3Y96_01026700 [Aphelenchoides besseyi]|nr:hypothetical protein M3Y96_01021900 [Aphelenchoides besseyi]KAI6193523.1 hypothetical protein M3Y96_01026700 [Aphelenchoides besseyi]